MHNQIEPRLSKWPFFLGDLLLVVVAGLVSFRSSLPLGLGQAGLITLCAGVGAVLGILPFVLEYRVAARLAESASLTEAVEQIQQLESVAQQISGATARWQSVQEVAERVASTSKAIAERMSTEARAFTEFLQRANESEKATLRLETEKLRRAEADWVHVVVRMLDHVYALHLGALRSGQPKLIAQLDAFQHACRDAARRIGLTPFTPNSSDPFDAQRHQVPEGESPPVEGAVVAETIATGYTLQGRLLRPALVRLQATNGNPGSQGESAAQGEPSVQAGPRPA